MATETPVVLISRPSALANDFQLLLGTDTQCVLSPILEIQMLDVDLDQGSYTGLVFTSQNGVRAAKRLMNLQGKTAFAIGHRTASLAAKNGMHVTHSGGDSGDLVSLIQKARPDGRLLHIRGGHSVGDVSNRLKELGIRADEIIAYLQKPLKLSNDARAVLRGENPVLVPLFSPRTSALLGAEFIRHRASVQFELVGISKSAIDAWKGPIPENSFVSDSPDMASVAKKTRQRIEQWA